ncbi:zinc transporter, ZIP family [Clostridium cavendishii DSM 21758]|uniref:Zinc transporter ZupT n=1 Tax=Clostridium cavendishii DSM 21758 TaxID=1121302 RepID=A0A1M6DI05_9CLOT|nr:zinc transporter ZupT [Clostridium cavendishii]SHI72743.1 zinc transporter, ZIP family [Clostridium cavendishii DSM 21758]
MNNLIFAFGVTLFAGLCTGIGSLLAFFTKKTNTKFLSISLGFSAGVMIYVSMVEIFFEAKNLIVGELGAIRGSWVTVIGFFFGIFFIALIDTFIPECESSHEIYKFKDIKSNNKKIDGNLLRLGLFTALAIVIHNFPEGIVTFLTAMQEPNIAIPIVIAIAIHNIPEGIAVSVPIYYATGSRRKAFRYSILSGLSEPIGGVVGYLILRPFINNLIFGMIFAAVAGIMVFISLDELLPSAQKYGEHYLSIYGLVAGMIVMAISLLLFI